MKPKVYTWMHEIELKPSLLLGLLLLGMAAYSLAAIRLAALPLVIQWILGVAVVGLGGWSVWRTRFTEAIRLTAEGQLQCRDEHAEWCDAEVLGDSLVSPVLIVLRYRTPALRVRTLVLLPDSGESEDLRRLRVSLRWARHTRSDTASPDAG